MSKLNELVIGIKSGGEIGSGIAYRLFKANMKNIFIMDIPTPLTVRRKVAFCEAVHDGKIIVEGVEAKKIVSPDGMQLAWDENKIPVIVDPDWDCIKTIKPHVVIDAIIAKRNLGTSMKEAPLTIGLGPGFDAGKDVHIAIETNRGHNLGRVISKGCPEPNTGIPGETKGFTIERVLRAPCEGIFRSDLEIGAMIKKDQVVGHVNSDPVIAQIDGILRGQIRTGTKVTDKLKIGDIDPRGEKNNCITISEKARAIGGSVLEAVLNKYNL
ncbi:MAG: selenium-dependent molybdenum cofactor biosynthesis protein YqeB [Thermodesulfobacteriota bacterium]